MPVKTISPGPAVAVAIDRVGGGAAAGAAVEQAATNSRDGARRCSPIAADKNWSLRAQ
jgi:hypothetical protein